MKPTPTELLEKISSHCYVVSTRYRFAKTPHWSKKYSEGQLAGLEYIDKLCFYFLQEEKSIPVRLRDEIMKQVQQYSCLNDCDYKNGLYDALNDILEKYCKDRE